MTNTIIENKINVNYYKYLIFIILSGMDKLFFGYLPNNYETVLLVAIYMLVIMRLYQSIIIISIAFILFFNGYYPYDIYNLFITLAFWVSLYVRSNFERLDHVSILNLTTLARWVLIINIIVALIQMQTYESISWKEVFNITVVEGRGAGFRGEPSYLVAPVFIYASLLLKAQIMRIKTKERWYIYVPLFASTVLITKSITVALMAPLFMILNLREGKNVFYYIVAIAVLVVIAFSFSERIYTAYKTYDNYYQIITKGVNSWRNVPDIYILTHYESYMFPRINQKASLIDISWEFYENDWMQYTFSMFSTSVLSIGLISTMILLISYYVKNLKISNSIGMPAYTYAVIVIMFFIQKADVLSWLAFLLITRPSYGMATHYRSSSLMIAARVRN